jgi:hypothetical protein
MDDREPLFFRDNHDLTPMFGLNGQKLGRDDYLRIMGLVEDHREPREAIRRMVHEELVRLHRAKYTEPQD